MLENWSWFEIYLYYFISNIVVYIICIHYFGRAHLTKNKDPELIKKYHAFVRTDMHVWDSLSILPGLLTGWIRWFIAVFLLTMYFIQVTIVMGCTNPDKIRPWQLWSTKCFGWFICRGILLLGFGLVYINVE